MKSMFDECSDLTSIPAFNVQNVTNMEGIFNNCFAITEIHMYGMKVSFQINDYRSKFTREALVEILNNLATVTSTQTFTMGSTNLAKLTDEDKAIATGKGWTLA
jgi:surface protein